MSLTKLDQLREYSDPEFVMAKAQELGLNPVHESSRAQKISSPTHARLSERTNRLIPSRPRCCTNVQ